jgi:hypothetical protein
MNLMAEWTRDGLEWKAEIAKLATLANVHEDAT